MNFLGLETANNSGDNKRIKLHYATVIFPETPLNQAPDFLRSRSAVTAAAAAACGTSELNISSILAPF